MESVTCIGSLRPFMKNLHLQLIVLQQGEELKVTREGHEIHSYVVADATGSIELLLWDEVGKCIRSGDILRLSSGYVTLYKESLRLYVSKYGKVRKIGEYNMNFAEVPNMSQVKWEPDPNHPQSFIIKDAQAKDATANKPSG